MFYFRESIYIYQPNMLASCWHALYCASIFDVSLAIAHSYIHNIIIISHNYVHTLMDCLIYVYISTPSGLDLVYIPDTYISDKSLIPIIMRVTTIKHALVAINTTSNWCTTMYIYVSCSLSFNEFALILLHSFRRL